MQHAARSSSRRSSCNLHLNVICVLLSRDSRLIVALFYSQLNSTFSQPFPCPPGSNCRRTPCSRPSRPSTRHPCHGKRARPALRPQSIRGYLGTWKSRSLTPPFFIPNPVLSEIPMLQSGVQSQTSGYCSCAHQVYSVIDGIDGCWMSTGAPSTTESGPLDHSLFLSPSSPALIDYPHAAKAVCKANRPDKKDDWKLLLFGCSRCPRSPKRE